MQATGSMMRGVVTSMLLMLAQGAAAQPVGTAAATAERHYRAGVELMRAESWSAAADEFRAATAADPLLVLAHYNLGQCRMAERRYVEAVAAYRATKAAFNDQTHAGENYVAERERDIEEEIRLLRDVIDQLHLLKDGSGPRRETEINARIQLLESMRYKKGETPQMPAEFPLALGSAYFRQNKMEEARVEYEEALKINPKLGPAHNNLAVIHLMAGRPQEAETELKAAKKNGFRVNPQLEADIKKATTGS